MGRVKGRITQPDRQFKLPGHGDIEHGVVKPPVLPFVYHRVHVRRKGEFVTTPHPDGWMVDPPTGQSRQHSKDLVGFNPLPAQSPVIEDPCGFYKIGIREKCLHNSRTQDTVGLKSLLDIC